MTGSTDLEMTGVAGAEPRRADRFPMRTSVQVCALGYERVHTGQGLNISATGMAFVICEALPLGTPIHVALPNCGLSALAVVRNCERHDQGWRVGVELVGSLV
jgi:hypothetical protein